MTNRLLMLCLVMSFWIVGSMALWWQQRSWFPFTPLVAALLLATAVLLDRIAPGWGTLGVSVLHILLWATLIVIMVRDRMGSTD